MQTDELTVPLDSLLLEFEAIRPIAEPPPPTYLEITGKAHKEDVISNVLAFFFDPDQPHGLGSLFYSTFMQCMGNTDDVSDERIEAVSREVTTAKGLRIDLVVETSKRILAIENKVHHWLNNDLDEYAAHIGRLDRVKTCHLAVLSLYPQQANSVPNITYRAFLIALEAQMAKHNIKVADNYAPFLKDFFTTIRNLETNDMLDEKLRKYFVENEQVLNRLLTEKSQFDGDVNSKAHKLMGMFENRPEVNKLVWERYVVINQKFFPNGLHLKVDCVIKYDGYWIHVFVQRHGKDNTTAETLNYIPYFKDCTDWNTWVNQEVIPFDTPLQEVADKVNEVLRIVFP